jgi:hypothetical protein
MRLTKQAARLAVLFGLLVWSRDAAGYIQRLYPLQGILDESTHIALGRVESVDRKARTAVAAMARPLKGKIEFRRVRMNIAVGPAHHAEFIIDRLTPGATVVLFYQRQGRNLASLVHTGNIWFQLFATDKPRDRAEVWWRMSHVEIYLGRTYNGTTDRLAKLLPAVLAERTKAPKPDPTVPKLDLRQTGRSRPVRVSSGARGGFRRQVEFRHRGGSEIRGVSAADVNGDERPDLLFCRQAGNVLLVNQPGGFRDDTRRLGLRGGSRTGTWADCDGDDHPDLFTNQFDLFANSGAGLRKHEHGPAAPRSRNPEGAGWIDVNADGRPDILVTNGQYGIRLYENTGGRPARFRDVSDRAGLGAKGLGRGNGDFAVFFDSDGDGRTDFLYNLGHGVLVRNAGNGTFQQDDRSGIRLAGGSKHKRGVTAADFDNDGDLELLVPGPARAQLYRNNSDGTFRDVAGDAGDLAKAREPSFSAAWGDVNCDGALDLFVCHPGRAARLYLGDGRGSFTDVSEAAGVRSLTDAYAARFVDLDTDGDLDLAVNLRDRMVVAFNEMPRAERCGPLVVRLHVRRGQIGARVRVYTGRDRLAGLRELGGADGCGGQRGPTAHFGLPAGTYHVSVCLSDGRAAVREVAVPVKGAPVVFGKGDFR